MKNRSLYEAFPALAELNAKSLPPLIALRVGRNLNAVRIVYESLDEVRIKLVKENEVEQEKVNSVGYGERLLAFNRAWNIVLDDQSEWSPPITIPMNMVENAKEFSYVAQLLAAEILV